MSDWAHYGTMPAEEKRPVETAAPYVAEFVGTFLLVFTAGACGVAGDPTWNATAIACILMVCIYMFGPVSGGHLNPAVSLATGIAGNEPWRKVVTYMAVQVVAGLLAGAAYGTVFEKSVGVGPPAASNFEVGHAGFIETAYTAMLVFVVLNVAYSRQMNPTEDQNHFFALAIGFVIVAGGYAGGGISGACFNPAVSFGLNFTDQAGETTKAGLWGLIYAGFQALGAVIGAVCYRLCRPEERSAVVDDNYSQPLLVRMLTEFLSTFMLALTVGLNLVMKTGITPWSAAAALMCAVYALGDVHVNPAVSVAVMLSRRGKCSPPRAVACVAAQLFAGGAAGLVVAVFHAKGPHASESFCLGPVARSNEVGDSRDVWAPVFWAECLFTFMLCLTVLAVGTARPPPSFTRTIFHFGFAIGACVVAGGFASGSLGGGALNPAVALSVTAGACDADGPGGEKQSHWDYFVYFALFELAGGFLAAPIFAVTHHHEFHQK